MNGIALKLSRIRDGINAMNSINNSINNTINYNYQI